MSHVHILLLRQMKNMLHIGITIMNYFFKGWYKKKFVFEKCWLIFGCFYCRCTKKLANFCWKICDGAENDTCCNKVGKKWNLILWAVCLRELVRVIVNQNCCCCTNRRGDNFSWMTRYRILKYSHSYYLWHYCAFFSQLCAFM